MAIGEGDIDPAGMPASRGDGGILDRPACEGAVWDIRIRRQDVVVLGVSFPSQKPRGTGIRHVVNPGIVAGRAGIHQAVGSAPGGTGILKDKNIPMRRVGVRVEVADQAFADHRGERETIGDEAKRQLLGRAKCVGSSDPSIDSAECSGPARPLLIAC